MSAPLLIDSLRFARSGECLTGTLPVASLGRLAETLASDAGTVHYRLCGVQRDGRPALELTVEAVVQMVCQRCLASYAQPIDAHSLMPIARDEAQLALWERDDPLLDALLAETQLDVAMLVEDEMLLSLPAVPRHPEGACGSAAG